MTVYDDALTLAYSMIRTSRAKRTHTGSSHLYVCLCWWLIAGGGWLGLTTGCLSMIAFISDGIAIGGSVSPLA